MKLGSASTAFGMALVLLALQPSNAHAAEVYPSHSTALAQAPESAGNQPSAIVHHLKLDIPPDSYFVGTEGRGLGCRNSPIMGAF
jgi:hypothetical protein